MSYRALVVDDDEACRAVVSRFLAKIGLQVSAARSGAEALQRLEQTPADLIITDMKMPGLSGIELIEAAKRRCPRAEVVLMTGFASVESAVHAMKLGAFDYLQKPFPLPDLGPLVDRALVRIRSRSTEPADPFLTPGVASAALLEEAGRLAAGDPPILIYGESGTGKRTLARAIHALGPRAEAPVRTLCCAALAADLQERELLQPGGLLDEAAAGTLLVSQVWAASPAVQREIVRLLDAQESTVGGETEGALIHPRIVATSDRDLGSRSRRGGFRPDLFERLAARVLTIPPLRNRRDEIVPLADALLDRVRARTKRHVECLSPDAAAWLSAESWPGNVAGLLATLEGAALLTVGPAITAADLDGVGRGRGARARGWQPADSEGPAACRERERILDALRRNAYNLTLTYQQLGVSRTTLWRKLKRHGISLTRGIDGPSA